MKAVILALVLAVLTLWGASERLVGMSYVGKAVGYVVFFDDVAYAGWEFVGVPGPFWCIRGVAGNCP